MLNSANCAYLKLELSLHANCHRPQRQRFHGGPDYRHFQPNRLVLDTVSLARLPSGLNAFTSTVVEPSTFCATVCRVA